MAERKRPNIVFIFADQHRHDAFGCAGNRLIETPNIDRLASQGVRFANAWCQSPICQPSRAALITGQYPHRLGVMRNFGPDMDPAWPTFMRQLQRSGYRTANIGKTHYYAEGLVEPGEDEGDMRRFSDRVAAFGFDHVVEEFDRYVHAVDGVETPYTQYLKREGVLDAYQAQIKAIWRLTPRHWDGVTSPLSKEQDLTSFLTREALSWLRNDQGDDDAKPFFLQLSYVQPHVPLMGDPDWAAYYADVDIPRGPPAAAGVDGKAPAGVAEAWADYLSWCGHHANSRLLDDDYVLTGARQYYAMISLIDECVGKLVTELDAMGELENTLIVYAADHGEMLGDHGLMAKFNFYRSSVQIPMIVRPPGGVSGKTVDDLVELVDVGPTLLEYAGAEALEGIDGRSFAGAVSDTSAHTTRTHLFSEIQKQSRKADASTFRAARNDRYRMTAERFSGSVCELFDLHEDPDELNNLADGANVDAVIDELYTVMQERTEDGMAATVQ